MENTAEKTGAENQEPVKEKTGTKTIRVYQSDLDYFKELCDNMGGVAVAFQSLIFHHKEATAINSTQTSVPETPQDAKNTGKEKYNVTVNKHCISLIEYIKPSKPLDYFVNVGVALALRHEHPTEFRLFMSSNQSKKTE